jgi:spectinomycin phosphotransferase
MKHRPPHIDDEEIITAVNAAFGIELPLLDFLPLGEGAWVYRGEDSAKHVWFIKLVRDSNPVIERVTTYLHDTLHLNFVAAPIASKLPEPPSVKDSYLTVYPFLEGEMLGSRDLNPFKAEIGGNLQRLHEAHLSDQLLGLLPTESFQTFQDLARERVRRARQRRIDDVLMPRLAKVMEAQARTIDVILENGRLVSDYCRARASTYEFVVCHADCHPYNVMNTPHGLMMVDWDGIMLAPRERDLMFYAQDMRAVTDLHRAYGLDYQLDEHLITYYAYEWVLQEFADYLGRLFDSSLGANAHEHALEEFELLFGGGDQLGGVVKSALDSPLP